MFRPLTLLIAAAILIPTSALAWVAPVPIDQRIDRSQRIAVGRVVDQHAYWADGRGAMTANRVAVSGWLKGHGSDREVLVLTPGGVVGDRATVVVPSLKLRIGQEYLLFLDADETKAHDRTASPKLRQSFAYAAIQGALPLQSGAFKDAFAGPFKPEDILSRVAHRVGDAARTPKGGLYVLEKAGQDPTPQAGRVINSFSPNPTHAGTIDNADFITISGSGFGAPGNVFYSNADDGGATLIASGVASDNVSWSATSIVNKPAEDAGTGPISINGTDTSAGSLTIDWAHIAIDSDFTFPVPTRVRYALRNLNGSGGMTFQYNNAFNGNAPAVAAFERALSSWRCESGVNYTPSGTTGVAAANNDDVNVVTFGTLPAGVLGRATTYFLGSANGACNMEDEVWIAEEIDIVFRPDPPVAGFPWNFGPDATTGSEFDFESVAVHELGHNIGLGHIISPGEVMHFALNNGADLRVLSPQDIDGAQNKVNYSDDPTCFNPGGFGTPMIPLSSQPAVCDLAGGADQIFSDGFE